MKINNIALYANEIEVAELALQTQKELNHTRLLRLVVLTRIQSSPFFTGRAILIISLFIRLKPGTREIALRILLNPEYTKGESHSELRDNLYRAISSNRSGRVPTAPSLWEVYSCLLQKVVFLNLIQTTLYLIPQLIYQLLAIDPFFIL